METLKLTTLFFLMILFSCRQNKAKHAVDSHAIFLNNEAMLLGNFISNIDSSKKALILLDSATNLNNNYYLGYFNKLRFQSKLKQYDKAVVTTQNLIRLKPNAHDLYIIAGVFYEKLNDTNSSKVYFEKSIKLCNLALDTMNKNNSDYELFMINKAVNFIMLDKNEEANTLSKEIEKTQKNIEMKHITTSMINLNKKQLINLYYSDQNSR